MAKCFREFNIPIAGVLGVDDLRHLEEGAQQELRYSHGHDREPDKEDIRKHDPCQMNRKTVFVDRIVESRSDDRDNKRSEDNAEQRYSRKKDDEGCYQGVGQVPRFLPLFGLDIFGKDRNKGRCQRTFSHEPPQEVRDTEGNKEGVCCHGRPVDIGYHHIAYKTEDSAQQGGPADNPGSFGDFSVYCLRTAFSLLSQSVFPEKIKKVLTFP